jgi:orotate phosphoribosyltransferase
LVKERLFELFREYALFRGEFTLASGTKSPYYFDGRRVTLLPEGAELVGKLLFELLSGKVDAIGGPTLGADPIAAAVALTSHIEGKPIPAFIVRGEKKLHGTQKRVEGHLPKGGRVAIVDDVITTGSSLLEAIEAVEAESCRVVKVIVLLDRHQGGSEELKRRGYDFTAILSADAEGNVKLA